MGGSFRPLVSHRQCAGLWWISLSPAPAQKGLGNMFLSSCQQDLSLGRSSLCFVISLCLLGSGEDSRLRYHRPTR